MKEKDIIEAYVRIRKIDNTIPDEVLDFMKDASIAIIRNAPVQEPAIGAQTWENIIDSYENNLKTELNSVNGKTTSFLKYLKNNYNPPTIKQ